MWLNTAKPYRHRYNPPTISHILGQCYKSGCFLLEGHTRIRGKMSLRRRFERRALVLSRSTNDIKQRCDGRLDTTDQNCSYPSYPGLIRYKGQVRYVCTNDAGYNGNLLLTTPLFDLFNYYVGTLQLIIIAFSNKNWVIHKVMFM